jgi:hypothetical protein
MSLPGLAILVNTCCEKTQFSYSKFCGHITATSLIDRNLVPVTNRYDNYDYDLCASFMHGYVFFFVLFASFQSELGRETNFCTKNRAGLTKERKTEEKV